MPTLARNHRQILAAKAVGGRRTRYTIEGVPGLWLDIKPRGGRTWYVRYQLTANGKRAWRYYRIGDASAVGLADAVERARQVRASVDLEGLDPFAAERVHKLKAVTFDDLFEDWYKRHALPRLARPRDDHLKYDNHLKPPFGERAVAAIKRTDLAALRDTIASNSGPVISNHIVALFNRVMNWAVEEGLIASNPGARLRKIGEERPRERVLSEDEIRQFWAALSFMDDMTGDHMARGEPGRMLSPATRTVLRLMLITGQRRGEIVEAEKTEFDLAGPHPVWTIPGNRTKNGLLHRLPLCPMAIAQVSAALAVSPPDSRYLFPSPVGDNDVPILATAITRAMSRMVSELGMASASPHDLRRTVGTEMARLGMPENVRALVLNHSPRSRGVTDAVYNRYAYDTEKRDALMAWERRLSAVIQQVPVLHATA